jgi:hypothetical protein
VGAQEQPPDDLVLVVRWQVGDLRINVTGSQLVIVKFMTKDLEELTVGMLPSDAQELGRALLGNG